MDLVKHRAVAATIGSLVAVALTGSLAASASAAAPKPFGHTCQPQDGVRLCPTVGSAQRVPTWDGVPLDADVTLPAQGSGPFPTIVMLHGWGGSKTDFESSDPAGDGSVTYHYNNNYYARLGYAVLNYTARGFGNSCGGGPSGDHSGACGQGYIRLADTRYEARDTQYLLGQLVDEGITKPNAIGVTGISYGGGQSMELAFLNNKIRKPDGTLAPWRSPDGTPLHIAASYPRWPWSDLVDALLPNGRFMDTAVAPEGQSLNPIGITIQSYVSGLFALGKITGYYCGDAPASAPCTNRDANLPMSFAEIQAGQPLSADAKAALKETYEDHDAYALRFVDGHSRPAPLLIENGWTDDLFPPEHALRAYNYLRSAYHDFPVSLQFGDLGHSRGSNKAATNQYLNGQAARFFAARLLNYGHGPAPGMVTAFSQACPASTPDGGPYKAATWRALQSHGVTFGANGARTVTSAGGSPQVAKAFDPIAGTTDSCKTIAKTHEPNTANYQHSFSSPMTMMGLPTVHANIHTIGNFGQIDARLWDIRGGQQRLISRGVYSLRNNQSGRIAFQLHGNGWRFAKGDVAVLQLLGRDAPYYQAGNQPFSVKITDLSVSLPKLAGGSAGTP
jgi:pimeloyl-ACP methyl ester carboxylesterase